MCAYILLLEEVYILGVSDNRDCIVTWDMSLGRDGEGCLSSNCMALIGPIVATKG
jgi:hypothetical protein